MSATTSTTASVITTYSPAPVHAGPVKPKARGLLQRFLDRMIEARMRKAEDVIRHQRRFLQR